MRLLKNLAIAAVSTLTLASAVDAHAFSTGPHYRVTDEGLTALGLSRAAIDQVHISNYQTDYIASKPEELVSGFHQNQLQQVAKYFHSDDLRDPDEVERQIAWLEQAGRAMAVRGMTNNNVELTLDAMGIVLHAVQDLYSHTNFADKDWPALTGTRIVTFDDVPKDLWKSPWLEDSWDNSSLSTARLGVFGGNSESADLYGTPHTAGDWPTHGGFAFCSASAQSCGINHDSVLRRNHLVASQMALRATVQWTQKFRSWMTSSFWEKVRTYRASAGTSSSVRECLAKMQETASFAGQWAYPDGQDNTQAIGWGIWGSGCEWDWQDTRWAYVLIEAFKSASPDHITGEWGPLPSASTPEFELPKAPPLNPQFFAGTYDIIWGSQTATLTLEQVASTVKPILRLANGQQFTFASVIPNGNAIELKVRPIDRTTNLLSGTFYLMSETKDAVAGFIRDSRGIPNGIYGSKRTIVMELPGPIPF